MGDWKAIKRNPGWYIQISGLYPADKFSVHVRGILAKFLHENDSYLALDPDIFSDHSSILGFIQSLKSELLEKVNSLLESEKDEDFALADILFKQYELIQAQNPLELFKVIRHSIVLERQTIAQLQQDYFRSNEHIAGSLASSCASPTGTTFPEISFAIDNAFKIVKFQDSRIRTGLPDVDQGRQSIQSVELHISEMIASLTREHGRVLREVAAFKKEQRLASLGRTLDRNVGKLETWFKTLTQHFFNLETNYLIRFDELCSRLGYQPRHSAHWSRQQIFVLRKPMIKNCLVIERQPEQSTTKQISDVMLCVLPCWQYPLSISRADVDVVFINEEVAKAVSEKGYDHSAGLPESATMLSWDNGVIPPKSRRLPETRQIGGNNTIKIAKLLVDEIVRGNERGEVLAERSYIYFRLKVKVDQRGNTETLWAISLPLTTKSHKTNQDPKAWSFIIWNNACIGESFGNFHFPDELPWCHLIEVLDQPFIALGRALSDYQKEYLREKIMGSASDPSEKVQKHDFCYKKFATRRDPEVIKAFKLSDGATPQAITVAEWIYYCCKILEWKPPKSTAPHKMIKPLKEYWATGKIAGFMGAEEMEEKLKEETCGTFIIRFPENKPDTFGLYLKTADPNAALKKGIFSTDGLNTLSLEERILNKDLPTRLFLDNGQTVDKKAAFGPLQFVENGEACNMKNGYFATEVEMRERVPSLVEAAFQPSQSTVLREASNIPGPSNSFLASFRRQHPGPSSMFDND